MSVASPEEYMKFGFFWKWLPNIFPYSVFCLARQRIHIVRQLLEASGSCRQTCSQQSDVRSFQLNMVSVPVSMRTRCRRWNAGTAPRLHEDPSSAMECGSEKGSERSPTQETSNEKRFSLTAGITFQLLHGSDVGSAQAGSVRFPCACWSLLLACPGAWLLVALSLGSVWFLFLVGEEVAPTQEPCKADQVPP